MNAFHLAIVLLAIGTHTAFCLECYICNSHIDADCLDFNETANFSRFLQECRNTALYNFSYCRKLDMSLDMDFGKAHPKEHRIHRDCGYEEYEDDRPCYYKSGYNTRTWVCMCRGDGCNPGYHIEPLTWLVLFPSTFCLSVFWQRGRF